MKNCAIVIPVYRELNAYEKFSYNVLKSVVKDKDIYAVCGNKFNTELKEHIETSKDGFIHTSNGRHIQVRSKDSKPYHPI